MAINRFTQYKEPERFNPLSFEELSFAPMALRNREDGLMDQRDILLNQLNNINVHDKYTDEFLAEKQRIEGGLDDFTKRIQKDGVGNLEILGEFRNLRNNYNKAVSSSGNIGKAHQLKKDMDASMAAYVKDAQEKGYDGETINARLAEEKAKFEAGLPNKLSEFNGNLPGFNPAFAPDQVALEEEAMKIQKMMGAIETEVGDYELVPQLGPDGKTINSIIVQTKDGTATNSENVKYFNAYMKDMVLDPNSKIGKYLAYTKQDPKTFLSRIDNLSAIMTSTKTTEVDAYAGQTSSGSSGSGSGKSSDEDPKAKWTKGNTGMHRELAAKSPEVLRQTIKETDDPSKLAYLNNLLMRSEQNRNRELQDPALQKTIEKNITSGPYKDVFKSLGINTVNDYKEFIEKPEAAARILHSDKSGFNEVKGIDMKLLSDINKEGTKYRGELVKKLAYQGADVGVNASNLVADEFYALWQGDSGEAGKNLQKTLANGLNSTTLRDMVGKGALMISKSQGDMDPQYTRVGITENTDEAREFLSALGSSPQDVKTQINGVTTGGVGGTPSIMLSIETGEGTKNKKRFDVSMDLIPNDDLTNEILYEIENGSDKQGKILARQIKSQINMRDLPVTLESNMRTSKENTEAILDIAKGKNAEYGLVTRGGSEKPPYHDWMFVKEEDGANFSVVVNDDMSYSTYKIKDGRKTPMTFEDLHKSMLIKEARGNVADAKDASETYKGTFMMSLLNQTADVSKLSEGGAATYSDKSEFQATMNDYINYVNRGGVTAEQIRAKGAQLFDRIAKLPVRSKIREVVLN